VLTGNLTRAAGQNVGSYAIGQGSLSAGSNYTIAYTGANFAITPASLSVSANSGQSKVYGSADPTLTYSYSGLVNGDTSSVFSGSQTRAAGQNVGSYAIGQGSLSAGSNYTIAYTGANFAITPAPVIVTALGGSSNYGSSPSNPGLSATGLQNGQSVNVLTGLSNSFGITSTSAVGSYTLHVIGTLTNPNYSLTGTNNGIWTVNSGSTPPPSPPLPTLPVTAAFPNYWPSIEADVEASHFCAEDETANCSARWLRRQPFLLANPFDHSDPFEHWLPAAAPAAPAAPSRS
jgi:hypothetical protein